MGNGAKWWLFAQYGSSTDRAHVAYRFVIIHMDIFGKLMILYNQDAESFSGLYYRAHSIWTIISERVHCEQMY